MNNAGREAGQEKLGACCHAPAMYQKQHQGEQDNK